MAIRVSSIDVKDIFDANVLTDIQIERFIETANLIVEKNLNTGDYSYTDAELEEIELYLSAHLCSLREPRAKSEQVDEISVSYQGKTGMKLDSTHYGQTAIMLDRFGILKNIGNKKLASVGAVKQFDSTDDRNIDYS